LLALNVRSLILAGAILIAALTLGVGSAGAKPVGTLTGTFDGSGYYTGFAFDGTDYYWADSEEAGDYFVSVVKRGSFVDHSVVEIARFNEKDGTSVESLNAGGGYVAISLIGYAGTESKPVASTRVVRVNRDGSNLVELASGKLNTFDDFQAVVENGTGKLSGCGTTVAAQVVSEAGEVVIGSSVADRASKVCGGKPNIDHWRYYTVSPIGATREIFSMAKTVRARLVVRHGEWIGGSSTGGSPALDIVDVVGDRAIFGMNESSGTYVTDLNTGALVGPYASPLGPANYYDSWDAASLDPSGRVALYSFRGKRTKKSKLRRAAGVFQPGVPSQPLVFAPMKPKSYLGFCGPHLIAQTVTHKGRDTFFEELDPTTFAVTRPIGTLNNKTAPIYWCTSQYLYGSGFKGLKATVTAVPLG
jgi:hypothetical protein